MEQYTFSNGDIALACEKAAAFLGASGVERREALRIRLTLEEVLLEYQARFAENAAYQLKCTKRLSALRIEIAVQGESFNPLANEADSSPVNDILAGIGLAPSWSYKNGKNYIVFIPRKKTASQTVKMIAAIMLSIPAGFLLTLMPDPVRKGASELFLTPVTKLFMGLISAVAGPLVFLSVLGSICSMGNMETLGRIGKRTLGIILGYTAIIGAGITAIAALFYNVSSGGGAGADFSQLLGLVYDIVPGNLFEPFLTGNALQIIFIAFIIGIAMLMLSSKVSGVFSFVEQLWFIVQTVMGIVSGMLPFAVFVIFTNMVASGNLAALLSSWKTLLIMVLLIAAYFAAMVLWVAAGKKVSPVVLVKKLLPTFMIAVTTASSAATFSACVRDADEKLGVSKKLVEFGVPLGQALFKPSLFVIIGVMQLSFAESYGMEITLSWLFIGYLTTFLLAFAVPPVAGGALMGFTIAFTQLGIPLEVMGIAAAMNAIIDFPATAMNISGWMLTIIDLADSLDMLDKKKLRQRA